MRRLGKNEEKVLLLLLTGLALPFTRSATAQYRLVRDAAREWQSITRYGLPRTVRLLEEKKLIKLERSGEDIFMVQPTKKGRERVSLARLLDAKLVIKKKWDGRWRLVVFDIPEKKRGMRNLLRQCLKNWDFRRLQASVFVSPYDCREAVEFLIRTCAGERYIKFIEAEHISRDRDIRRYFALPE
jgi:DNA-binding transcriptional regulator PaaX